MNRCRKENSESLAVPHMLKVSQCPVVSQGARSERVQERRAHKAEPQSTQGCKDSRVACKRKIAPRDEEVFDGCKPQGRNDHVNHRINRFLKCSVMPYREICRRKLERFFDKREAYNNKDNVIEGFGERFLEYYLERQDRHADQGAEEKRFYDFSSRLGMGVFPKKKNEPNNRGNRRKSEHYEEMDERRHLLILPP